MHPPNFKIQIMVAATMPVIPKRECDNEAITVTVESSRPSIAAEFNLFSLDIMKMLFAKIPLYIISNAILTNKFQILDELVG